MRRPRGFAFWVSVLTVALVVVLRPLAQASPADPTWIAGFYDDADFDDVVYHIVTSSGVDVTGLALRRPAPGSPDSIVSDGSGPTGAVHGSSPLTRAPPLPFALPV
ncbi:MAG TPA: hypothetical protein VFO08_17980 [Methylomirabilota bacterium]|nr:hypothetical protein [Methylomirabilota bacterium]